MLTDILFEHSDSEYKAFQSKLIPNIKNENIIGLRIPVLRNIAKEIFGTQIANDFLCELPHRFYDENNLHAFLVEQIKDFDILINETERFLPYIDNWATCDSFNPKLFNKSPGKLLPYIYKWLDSKHAFTVRYAIKLLMTYFLDDLFKPDYMKTVACVISDEYYVNMMIAWYFATALAKQYESSILYFEKGLLPVWVHNKAIQKAIESNRIDATVKKYLKTLKVHS